MARLFEGRSKDFNEAAVVLCAAALVSQDPQALELFLLERCSEFISPPSLSNMLSSRP